jgi:hypothetical protein
MTLQELFGFMKGMVRQLEQPKSDCYNPECYACVYQLCHSEEEWIKYHPLNQTGTDNRDKKVKDETISPTT